MTYATIQPPFTLKFREMSREELKDYHRWFLGVLSDRVEELEHAVRETQGFELWRTDLTPTSLNMLGEWFVGQVQIRQRTSEEVEEIAERSDYRIDIPRQELTNHAFSLAIDVGMYVSQVFLANHPTLRWEQPFGGKKFIDYGQPVLSGFGTMFFNPVRMMVTLAYGLADGTKRGMALREIYDIWSKKVTGEPTHSRKAPGGRRDRIM